METKMQVLLDNYWRVEIYKSTMNMYVIKCFNGQDEDPVISEVGDNFEDTSKKALDKEFRLLTKRQNEINQLLKEKNDELELTLKQIRTLNE